MKETIRSWLRATGYELRRYLPGSSSEATLALLLKHNEVDLVLDVGANNGQYARLLRTLGYAGRIVSFEPLSRTYEELLQSSQGDPLWSVAPRMALGNSDGDITLHVSDNLVSSSVRRVTDEASAIEPGVRQQREERVRMARLDSVFSDWAGDSRNPFLKIDVQGFEDAVLEGAERTLGAACGVQIELALKPLYKGQPGFREIHECLEQRGFELYAILPGYTDRQTGRMMELDGIFFRSVSA